MKINFKRFASIIIGALLTLGPAQVAEASPNIFLQENTVDEQDQVPMFNTKVNDHVKMVGIESIINTVKKYIFFMNKNLFSTDSMKTIFKDMHINSAADIKDLKDYIIYLADNMPIDDYIAMLKSSIISSPDDIAVIDAYKKLYVKVNRHNADYEKLMDFMYSFIGSNGTNMLNASDGVRVALTYKSINLVEKLTAAGKMTANQANEDVVSIIEALGKTSMSHFAYLVFKNDCEQNDKAQTFQKSLDKLATDFPYSSDQEELYFFIGDTSVLVNLATTDEQVSGCEDIFDDEYTFKVDVSESTQYTLKP